MPAKAIRKTDRIASSISDRALAHCIELECGPSMSNLSQHLPFIGGSFSKLGLDAL
jgi:hypothetical protein